MLKIFNNNAIKRVFFKNFLSTITKFSITNFGFCFELYHYQTETKIAKNEVFGRSYRFQIILPEIEFER